jgi:predicted nucleic acid-binding protein
VRNVSSLVLVDTSVWVDHLRARNEGLVTLLEAGDVVLHPLVIAELACGTLKQRAKTLALLRDLPQAPLLVHDHALEFLEARKLMGRGLGWIDVNLLASATHARLNLWTLDRRLAEAAVELGIGQRRWWGRRVTGIDSEASTDFGRFVNRPYER